MKMTNNGLYVVSLIFDYGEHGISTISDYYHNEVSAMKDYEKIVLTYSDPKALVRVFQIIDGEEYDIIAPHTLLQY